MTIVCGNCELTYSGPAPRCITHNVDLERQEMYDNTGSRWYNHYCPVSQGNKKIPLYNDEGKRIK